MRTFGVAALVVALAAPAAAQQTTQGNEPRQGTAAGDEQNTPQTDRARPSDMPTSRQNQGANRGQQEDRDAAATSGQTDRGVGPADQENSELPATASPIMAIALLGFLSLAGAALLRRRAI